ncbi:MAG: Nif3-like dinuclear metal center hexameric protein [Clostridia bacterium]|nr:Nif3-like dinuclear metal center hexameric protein [Clostridia bacterium]
MRTVRDFYDFLDEIAPFSSQEGWDNSGLLVGSFEKEVNRVAVALDLNKETLDQAISLEVDLIITHHPVIFKAQKTFLSDCTPYRLAENSISLISTHTPLDSADGGINDILCDLLELTKVEVLSTSMSENLLRVGFTDKTTPEEFARFVSRQLSADVRFCDGENEIETVAVCSGAGADFAKEVAELGIDAFVTGDAKYHEFLDAKEDGLTLIAAGHFETENPAMAILAGKLRGRFSETDIIVLSQTNPIKYLKD